MSNNYYVYGLYAPDRLSGSLFYVGKGKTKRMYDHYLPVNLKKNTHKNNVIKLYSTFPGILQGGLSEHFAYELEKCLISLYKPQLTNKTEGGEGASGLKHSSKTKAKMSELNAGANNPNFGKKHSAKTRAKMSKAGLGRVRSAESKLKQSKSSKGKVRTQEHKERYSQSKLGELNPFYGKKHSPEVLAKISAANKGSKRSEETKAKISASNKGKIISAEARAKISAANKGRIPANKVDRNFIYYHLWAQSISGLSAAKYCLNMPFTCKALAMWKHKSGAGLL